MLPKPSFLRVVFFFISTASLNGFINITLALETDYYVSIFLFLYFPSPVWTGDLKTFQSHNISQLPWIGPLPGDIAEVEAYCRIFRAAERLHSALMDTLCNPVTGECSVSYAFPSEDKPLLEDKIVSVLGCMICLLNKGREDLLSGRSTIMNSFSISDVNLTDDKLPPLAIFRGEMKRYCESLHVALENYLTTDDPQRLDVWRKLQRLKNVCYDSGLPRGDDYPPQTLFANWGPVYLSTSKREIESDDSEVAFWRGSQLTEESLKWLLEKGFKTIVDIRAETVKDNFYQIALDEAIFCGKVELIRLPVEVGTAPSVEQVEKFAALLSDSRKKPIYVHSKEGVWRTSAMVSRWRQYMARYGSKFISNQAVPPSYTLSRNERTGQLPPVQEEGEAINHIARLTTDKLYLRNVSVGVFSSEVSVAKGNQEQNKRGKVDGIETTTAHTIDDEGGGLNVDFCSEVNPLESQLPPSDVFSRKLMSSFFKKNISPTTYFTYERRRLEILSELRGNHNGMIKKRSDEKAAELRLTVEGSSNGSPRSPRSIFSEPYSHAGNGTYKGDGHRSYDSSNPNVNGIGDGERYALSKMGSLVKETDPLDVNSLSSTSTLEQGSNGKASMSSRKEDLELVEGNMCASTTGVVRIQSRKKAEMFLVRTDGISCSREKVTESSLAFTHPSTQQQMLMWKSTPKTVLLLKKLGQELMEQAKEVAKRVSCCYA